MNFLDFVNLYLKVFKRFVLRKTFDPFIWAVKNYEGPAPFSVKIKYLLKHSYLNATWVETGTYLGETTRKLSAASLKVYSIEPSDLLFSFSQFRFRNNNDINLLHGTSEALFPSLIGRLSGPVNFWLDGHFSGDITYRGDIDSPIVNELESIELNLHTLSEVAIFVDDVRLFGVENSGYPELGYLVQWCNRNRFTWVIELDIFKATRISNLQPILSD